MIKYLILFFLLTFNVTSASSSPTTQSNDYGMVVSDQKLASQVGIDILRAGGNAIDAAVAVGYALAVVTPCCGNIGGGGFMLIHFANGKDIFVNFREKAPLNVNQSMYLDAQGRVIPGKSATGYLAVAVPGTVLGLDTALQKYGTMNRSQVMAPAIKLAENGFTVSPCLAAQLKAFTKDFRKQSNVSNIFLKKGTPYQTGDTLIQKDLANTLKQISTAGSNSFYHGQIAKTIVKASQDNGGIITIQDFNNYTIEELQPLYCDYRGYTIISAPPPSSGGVTLCEMLNILENFPLHRLGYRSVQTSYYILEAMRYGFIDRNTKLGDPDQVNNPIQQLLSKTYAKDISQKIQENTKFVDSSFIDHREAINTTHYSVLDKYGNAVSVTYTLNSLFGAGVIAGDTGFFLNNQMDDFVIKPGNANQFGLVGSSANLIRGGKRPLSSMTPTIVLKDGKIFLILGSPGGPRIITSVLLTLLNVIDFQLDLKQAIAAPRFHFQSQPNWIDTEPFAFNTASKFILEMMGYHFSVPGIAGVNTFNTWGSGVPLMWGSVEAIKSDGHSKPQGVADKRRPDGAALLE